MKCCVSTVNLEKRLLDNRWSVIRRENNSTINIFIHNGHKMSTPST